MTAIGVQLLDASLRWVFLGYSLLVVAHFLIQTTYAHLAFRRTAPSRTISVAIGSAATIAVSPSECATGSKSWV